MTNISYCLVSLHFLFDILSMGPVHVTQRDLNHFVFTRRWRRRADAIMHETTLLTAAMILNGGGPDAGGRAVPEHDQRKEGGDHSHMISTNFQIC